MNFLANQKKKVQKLVTNYEQQSSNVVTGIEKMNGNLSGIIGNLN